MLKMLSRLKKMIGIRGIESALHEATEDERGNWAQLPSDLVRFIARQLTIPERVRLGAVCSSWSSALKEGEGEGVDLRSSSAATQFPMAALSPIPLLKKDLFISKRRRTLSLYSHPEKRCYHLSLPPRSNCYGCCDGWLILGDVSLFNPATQVQINLPTLSTIEEYSSIEKVVLSASPTARPDGFVAVALYDVGRHDGTFRRVASYRSGDEGWTPMCYFSFSLEEAICPMDLVYHDETFFLLSQDHGLLAFDLTGPSPVVFEFEDSIVDDEDVDGIFLVPSAASGDLLCVEGKMSDTKTLEYESFAIKRFDPQAEGSSCWVEIEDLGDDQSLFLSSVNSVSLSSADGHAWMKGNCIYFMEEEEEFMGRSFPGNKFIKWLLGIGNYSMRRFRFVKAYAVEEGVINPFFEFEEDIAMGDKGIWFLPSLL